MGVYKMKSLFIDYIKLKITLFYMIITMDFEKPKEERRLFLRMINKGQRNRLFDELYKNMYRKKLQEALCDKEVPIDPTMF